MKAIRSSFLVSLAFWWASLVAPGAQVPAENAPPQTKPGLLTGTVRGAVVGDPVEDVSISATVQGGPTTTAVTDARGRYELRLGAGLCQVIFQGSVPGSMAARWLTIRSGETVTLDVEIPLPGSISGRVLGDTKKPLPNIIVSLVTRRYEQGELTYRSTETATTDDRGIYTLRSARPGVPYLVVARAPVAQSLTGADRDSSEGPRRSALRAAVYPAAGRLADGTTLRLRPAESRRDIDLVMTRSEGYCIRGTLRTPTYSGSSVVRIRPLLPMNASPVPIAAGGDGRFAVCGLPPDEYEFSAAAGPTVKDARLVGTAVAQIVDKDVDGVLLTAREATPLLGRIELIGEGTPTRATAQVTLRYADDSCLTVDLGRDPLPRKLSFLGRLCSRFGVSVSGLPQGFYAKEIVYATSSVLDRKHDPLGPEAELRIIVAGDGGFLAVSVSDRDGRPVGGSFVTILAAGAKTAPEIAGSVVLGVTDASGNYRSRTLRPGTYRVLATNIEFMPDPETVAQFERAYGSGVEVEIGSKATQSVQLRQTTLP